MEVVLVLEPRDALGIVVDTVEVGLAELRSEKCSD
jgi:hypothetical protein